MEKFKSSYSKGMLLATCLVFTVLLLAGGVVIYQLVNSPMESLDFIGHSIVFVFILAALFYAFTSQIESVCLTKEHLIIKKMVGEVLIARCEIVHIKYKKSLMSDLRVFGVSGLFGHLGWFWNKNSGKYLAFIKDGNSMLEIKTTGKMYVVSCDDYTEVIHLVNLDLETK